MASCSTRNRKPPDADSTRGCCAVPLGASVGSFHDRNQLQKYSGPTRSHSRFRVTPSLRARGSGVRPDARAGNSWSMVHDVAWRMPGETSRPAAATSRSSAKGFCSGQNEISQRRIIARHCTVPLDATSGSLYDDNQCSPVYPQPWSRQEEGRRLRATAITQAVGPPVWTDQQPHMALRSRIVLRPGEWHRVTPASH